MPITRRFARRLACAVVIAAAAAHPIAVAAADSCGTLGGTVGTDQICRVHLVTPAYEITMTFPLDYPDQRAVAAFLEQDRDEFVDWVTTFGPDGRGRPYQYTVTPRTFRSGPPDAGTRSLVLEIASDTGLANQGHPYTSFQAFNFDVGEGAPITFDTLFTSGTAALAMLNPIVQREVGAAPTDLDATAYRNFAVTDDAVMFFFGQNEVVQDNNGPHEIAVPRQQLSHLLA